MPMIKSVLGLDVGSHAIKAVELQQTLRGLEPIQLRLCPRQDPDSPLDEVLRPFIKQHHLGTHQVLCAIPGDRLSSRRLDFPFKDRKKLRQAVPFEVEGEIPFDVEDVVIDWEIVSEERGNATVSACIAQRKHVGEMLEDLRRANCEPRVLEAEGFVLANLAKVFDLTGTRLLADLGHRKTTLCLLREGRAVATRTFPVGGQRLSAAIAKSRNCTEEEAERAKCEEGIFDGGFERTDPAPLAVMDRIAREIVRTLESLEPILGGTPVTQVSEITLFGGTAKLHRIDEYLTERTGIRCARLGLPPTAEGALLVAGGDPLLFASAIALALRGTAQSVTRMNFRQDEFAYRTDFRQVFGKDLRLTAALVGTVAVLAGSAAATSYTLDSRRTQAIEAQIATMYSEVFPGKPAVDNPVRAMREAGVEARDRADFLGVYGGNRSALDLLGELSARVPPDLELKFEEVSIDRRVIRIKVFAKSFEAADRLTAELAAKEPFEGAKIDGEVKASRKRGGKTFNVTIALEVPGEDS